MESGVGLRAEDVLRRYLEDLRDAICNIDVAELEAFTSSVVSALTRGSSVFIAGSGGSACASLHMASDWAWATASFSARPRVRALVDSIARLTALANDVSYDQALALQLDCAQPCDLLAIVSVSGGSTMIAAPTVPFTAGFSECPGGVTSCQLPGFGNGASEALSAIVSR